MNVTVKVQIMILTMLIVIFYLPSECMYSKIYMYLITMNKKINLGGLSIWDKTDF